MRRIKKAFIILITLLLFAALSVFTACSEGELNTTDLMRTRETIRMFNVNIVTAYYPNTQGSYTAAEGESVGSGVIFYETEYKYYALTNNHVITDTPKDIKYNKVTYTVTDIFNYKYSATLELTDESRDIAIISFIKNGESVLKTADYKSRLTTNMNINEFVLAVGNPNGISNVVTFGSMLGYARIKNESYTISYPVLYHNALLHAGNSGGALCDAEGKLLGINTWGTEDRDDMNYAIPLSVINDFVDQFFAGIEEAA